MPHWRDFLICRCVIAGFNCIYLLVSEVVEEAVKVTKLTKVLTVKSSGDIAGSVSLKC